MNIFADFHHPALYYSLHLLFEKRLGYTLYRPIGREWNELGHWKLTDLCTNSYQLNEKLSELLIPNAVLPYANTSWNRILSTEDNCYVIDRSGSLPCKQKGVTYDQFKETKFDLMLASFVNNVKPFKQLAVKHQKSIPTLVQVGNPWNLDQFKDEPVIASLRPRSNNIKNIVFYKQEFDLDLFRPSHDPPKNLITSFVDPIYLLEEDQINISKLQSGLKGKYKIQLHGKQSQDGYVADIVEISNTMKKSKFGLHLKFDESGYGHVIHNWFAVGRPIIFRSSQHENGLAKELLRHMVTGIDIDKVGINQCLSLIQTINDEKYYQMCNNVRLRFDQIVDFDQDANNIKNFLHSLM